MGTMEIKTRKQLKELLDWYEELLLEENDRRKVISKIFFNYETSQKQGGKS